MSRQRGVDGLFVGQEPGEGMPAALKAGAAEPSASVTDDQCGPPDTLPPGAFHGGPSAVAVSAAVPSSWDSAACGIARRRTVKFSTRYESSVVLASGQGW